jgi:hypothetical protein
MSFAGRLLHTCTIQSRSLAAASAAGFGHGSATWSDYATGVACRLAPLSGIAAARQAELVSVQTAGAPVSYWTLYLAWRSDLLADGAAATYRISNVRRAVDGSLVDAGPFDIEMARDAAGQGHHLEVALTRAPVT